MKPSQLLAVTLVLHQAVLADSAPARCDIYPVGSDQATSTEPCTFSQRQGYISITRESGTRYDLSPVENNVGEYRDQHGKAAYRQSGLGDQGLIFRLANESIYVYWDTSSLTPRDNNPTWPFTTSDYDATTLLPCKAAGAKAFQNCPAGISHMDYGQASITVQNQTGEQFTINLMKDYVNASNRELTATLKGDTWELNFANGEVWKIPVAALTGD